MKTMIQSILWCVAALLGAACSGRADDRELERVAAIISAAPSNYSLDVFVIPERIQTSSPVTASQIEARYAFRLSLNGEFTQLPIERLAGAVVRSKANQSKKARGDFRWALLVTGVRGERVLSLALDRRAKVLLFEGHAYELDDGLEDWMKTQIDPLISALMRKE